MIAPGPLLADGLAVRARGARGRRPPSSRPASSARSPRASSRGSLAIAEARGSFDPADVDGDRRDRRRRRRARGREALRRRRRRGRRARRGRAGRRRPGDDGVRAVVVPVGATSPRRGRRASTAAAGSRTSTSTACASAATACSATRDASAAPALRRALEEATVALALEMVGTAQTIFDITLEYAKQREQFGVPIGSFQAIKHKFADMMVALERARATRLLRGAHDRRGRPAAHERDVGGEGRGRRLPAPARQGGHPDPRRHRLHVGARHAPLREAHQVGRAAVRHRAAWHRARIADLLGV